MWNSGVLADYFHYRLKSAAEELLVEVLTKKFGQAPPDIAEEMRHCHELDVLKDWVMTANTAESLDLFRKYILQTNPTT